MTVYSTTCTTSILKYRKLAAQLTPMRIPPWNGVNTRLNEVTAAVKYQTLWTAANWTDEIKMKYIMHSEFPKDFNLSVYYAESRELLIQDSTKKAKPRTRVKKVEGCPAEDFRVKRLPEKHVDPATLNHAQLLTIIEKLQAENCSQQQELDNEAYEQQKNANKNTTNTWHQELEKYKLMTNEHGERCSEAHKTSLGGLAAI